MPIHTIDLIKSIADKKNLTAFFQDSAIRVDKYCCSHNAKQYEFLWVWHGGKCAGLSDPAWKPTNGGALGISFCSEIKRLQSFGLHYSDGISIDIGAHMGDSTIPMAILSNKTIAFDPSLDAYRMLHVNSAINSPFNIETFPFGVSSNGSEIEFQYGITDEFECNGGVKETQRSSPTARVVKRPTVNLENFLSKTYGEGIFSNIKYIKIDVEGYDRFILQSLFPLIRKLSKQRHSVADHSTDTTNDAARSANGGYRRLPLIQVEYFDSFRKENNDATGALGKDSSALFTTILQLPGKYSAYCTNQCNYNRDCVLTRNRLRIQTALVGGVLTATHVTSVSKDQSPHCDDIMLVPRGMVLKKR